MCSVSHYFSHVELKPHLVGPIANNGMFHSEIILHIERCSLLVIGLWYELMTFIVSLPCHLFRIKQIWASKKQSGRHSNFGKTRDCDFPLFNFELPLTRKCFLFFGLTCRNFVSWVHLYENLLSGSHMVESQYVKYSLIKYSLISMTSHVSRMNIYKVDYLPGRQVGSMFASFHD